MLQFARTTSSYSSWVPAIAAFGAWAGWTQLVTLHAQENLFTLTLPYLAGVFMLPLQLQFTTGRFESAILERIALLRYRVVLAMAATSHDMLKIALGAYHRGLLARGWVWLGLDQLGGVENEVTGSPEEVANAKLALRGWVYFQPRSDAPEGFYERARNATLAADGIHESGITSSTYAANMYEAVVLYATAFAAVNVTMPGGRRLVQAMRTLSYRGMTGQVALDTNLDMLEVIEVMNYATAGAHQVGLCYPRLDGTRRRYEPVANRQVVWPGGSSEIPADAEDSPQPFQLSAGAAAAISAVCVVAAIILSYTCLTKGHIICLRMVVPIYGARPRW